MLRQEPARLQVVLARLPRLVERQQRNPYAPVRTPFHRFLEERPEPGRVSIRRQPHDFVFVGVEIETEVKGDEGIQNSNRVIRRDSPYQVQFASAALVDGSAVRLRSEERRVGQEWRTWW